MFVIFSFFLRTTFGYSKILQYIKTMSRTIVCQVCLLAITLAGSTYADVYPGYDEIQYSGAEANAIISVSEQGIKASCKVTSSGVGFTVQTGCNLLPIEVGYTRYQTAILQKLELQLSSGASNTIDIYPVMYFNDSPLTNQRNQIIERGVTFDSTSFSPGAQSITLTPTYKLIGYVRNPDNNVCMPITKEVTGQPLTVNFNVVNNLLINSTNQEGGDPPPTWNGNLTLPSDPPGLTWEAYSWTTVAFEMTAHAKAKIPNHTYLSGTDFHLKTDLINDSQNPNGSKLFSKANVWFNSSHGSSGGVYDNNVPRELIPWSSIGSCFGSRIVSTDLALYPLRLNMAFLYSCRCAQGISASTFFGSNPSNQAAIAFQYDLYTNLKAGDTSATSPYNNAQGVLLMVDKLSQHTGKLFEVLNSGETINTAKSEANQAFAPRCFDHCDAQGRNIMKRNDAWILGDVKSRLTTVYRPSYTDNNQSYFMMPNNKTVIIKNMDPITDN